MFKGTFSQFVTFYSQLLKLKVFKGTVLRSRSEFYRLRFVLLATAPAAVSASVPAPIKKHAFNYLFKQIFNDIPGYLPH